MPSAYAQVLFVNESSVAVAFVEQLTRYFRQSRANADRIFCGKREISSDRDCESVVLLLLRIAARYVSVVI